MIRPSLVQSGRTIQCTHCRRRLSLKRAVGMVALSRAVDSFSEKHRACNGKRPEASR